MPLLGYGVFRILDAVQCERCVAEALQTGYRLIDTAASYFNEEAVGNAVRTSGIPREELFLTTKLWMQDSGYENTLRAFDDSLKKLALEKLYREGCIRAIGVSNFEPDRLADLCLNHEIAPMVNQVEIHPFHQQPAAVKVMKTFGVQPQAWGVFGGRPAKYFQRETAEANRREVRKNGGTSRPALALAAWYPGNSQNHPSGTDGGKSGHPAL